MKKIILLFCFAISASLSYGQMKVVTNGDVKVGNTSANPTAKLHVEGPAATFVNVSSQSPNGLTGLRFINSNFGWTFFQGSTGNFTIKDEANNSAAFLFAPGAGQRAVNVVAGGNVGIGGLVNPAAKLHVNGDIIASAVITPSMKSLKSNIDNFSLGLDQIMDINPMSYVYNGKGGITSERIHFGVIAEEFQKIVPEAVFAYAYKEADDEGNVLSTEEFLSVDEKAITYMLVNAVKEQQAIINAQAEKLSALEEVVNTLGSSTEINRTNVTLSDFDLAELQQNIPNPFALNTQIEYTIPSKANNSQMIIYNTEGRIMKTLNLNHVGLGVLSVDASDLPAGTYTYQLVVDGKKIDSSKMVVVD